MEEMTTYCRSKTGKIWYVYGFKFNTPHAYEECIVCYDKNRILKKRNQMYLIEGPSSIKDMMLSKDPKDHVIADLALNAIFKSTSKKLIKHN